MFTSLQMHANSVNQATHGKELSVLPQLLMLQLVFVVSTGRYSDCLLHKTTCVPLLVCDVRCVIMATWEPSYVQSYHCVCVCVCVCVALVWLCYQGPLRTKLIASWKFFKNVSKLPNPKYIFLFAKQYVLVVSKLPTANYIAGYLQRELTSHHFHSRVT